MQTNVSDPEITSEAGGPTWGAAAGTTNVPEPELSVTDVGSFIVEEPAASVMTITMRLPAPSAAVVKGTVDPAASAFVTCCTGVSENATHECACRTARWQVIEPVVTLGVTHGLIAFAVVVSIVAVAGTSGN